MPLLSPMMGALLSFSVDKPDSIKLSLIAAHDCMSPIEYDALGAMLKVGNTLRVGATVDALHLRKHHVCTVFGLCMHCGTNIMHIS